MLEQVPSKHDKPKILVATDIFGETKPFNLMLEQLGGRDRFQVISPYQHSRSDLTTEALAYQSFKEHGGIHAYASKLTEQFAIHESIQVLIGFSAGGAALYQAASCLPHQSHKKLVLFYPGQIRYMLTLQLEIHCHIIFPCEEAHFDLAEVMGILNTKSFLSLEQAKYHHGFMNALSNGFSQQAYKEYSRYLCKLIS